MTDAASFLAWLLEVGICDLYLGSLGVGGHCDATARFSEDLSRQKQDVWAMKPLPHSCPLCCVQLLRQIHACTILLFHACTILLCSLPCVITRIRTCCCIPTWCNKNSTNGDDPLQPGIGCTISRLEAMHSIIGD